MENESDELTGTGFRRCVINISELKERVITQCKETKDLEKSFDEMLARIHSLKGDSRWRFENNPGLERALNSQTVSQCCISRLIFVAHRTGKSPGIKEMPDARQRSPLA